MISPLLRSVIFLKLKSTILTELSNEKHPAPAPAPALPGRPRVGILPGPPPPIDGLILDKNYKLSKI